MQDEKLVSQLDIPKFILLLMIAFGLWITFVLFRPFFDSIAIAGILAIVMQPVNQRVLVRVGGRPTVAALLTSALLIFLVLIPAWFLFWQLLSEAASIFQNVSLWVASDSFQDFLKQPRIVSIMTILNSYLAEIQQLTGEGSNQNNQTGQMGIQIGLTFAKRVLDSATNILANSISFLGNFLLMVFAFFFFVRDHKKIQNSIFKLFPFTEGHEQVISERINLISRSTLLGTFIVAIAQGAATAIAFWLTGLPVVLGALATAFASFIPIVGTGLIWIPAIAYLLAIQKFWSAIFILFWGTVIVGFVLDNLLRQVIVAGGWVNAPLLFFFIIGGMNLFGIFGVLYGPVLLAALYILFYIYDITFGRPGLLIK